MIDDQNSGHISHHNNLVYEIILHSIPLIDAHKFDIVCRVLFRDRPCEASYTSRPGSLISSSNNLDEMVRVGVQVSIAGVLPKAVD